MKVHCFFLVMFLILTHSSISLFQTQNRKIQLTFFFRTASTLWIDDINVLYMLYIQNSCDENLCIPS